MQILSSFVGTTNKTALDMNLLANDPCFCQYPPFCSQQTINTNTNPILQPVLGSVLGLLPGSVLGNSPVANIMKHFWNSGGYFGSPVCFSLPAPTDAQLTACSCDTASNNCGHFVAVHIYLALIVSEFCNFTSTLISNLQVTMFPKISPTGCHPIFITSENFQADICKSFP